MQNENFGGCLLNFPNCVVTIGDETQQRKKRLMYCLTNHIYVCYLRLRSALLAFLLSLYCMFYLLG